LNFVPDSQKYSLYMTQYLYIHC